MAASAAFKDAGIERGWRFCRIVTVFYSFESAHDMRLSAESFGDRSFTLVVDGEPVPDLVAGLVGSVRHLFMITGLNRSDTR